MMLSSKSPSAVLKAVFLLEVPPANSQWQGPGSKTVVILPMFLMSCQSVAVGIHPFMSLHSVYDSPHKNVEIRLSLLLIQSVMPKGYWTAESRYLIPCL